MLIDRGLFIYDVFTYAIYMIYVHINNIKTYICTGIRRLPVIFKITIKNNLKSL